MGLGPVVVILVAGLLIGLISGLPVALVLLSTGIAAFVVGEGLDGLRFLASLPWGKSFSFELASIPLYVLMGYMLQESGLVKALFRMFANWSGRVPGSLGVVVLLTSGIFSAMSGSGGAATASLGAVAASETKRYGYHTRLILGVLNGGGSLAPVVPPSIALIVYASLTDQSIIRMFAAGVMPGLLALILMLAYVITVCSLNPSLAPPVPAVPWREKWASLWVLGPSATVIGLILGGIFLGWFTPTEAAATGVVIIFVLLALMQRFDWRAIAKSTWRAVSKAGTTTAFVLFLVVSGFIYSHTLTFFGLPHIVGDALAGAGLQPWQLYLALLPLLLVLGCFLDSLTMQVITVPFILPLLIELNIDLVAFGVFVVLMVEVGTMTPPFGIHLFILQGVTKSSYQDAVLGALPFSFIWLFLVVLLMVFPGMATWLPNAIL